jgi:hypothetical protein
MVLLGLVLILLAALAIVAALFTAEVSGSNVELLGVELGPVALFLVGLGAGLAIWWGFWILTAGSKRSMARRREQKRLNELSEQLDRVEADRRADVDHQEDKDRPTL